MEARVNFTLVGLFVVVFGSALIAGVLWLSSGRHYGQQYDVYRTYMSESVGGLNLNAPVRYHGVEVGFVRAIELAPGDVERVQLTLAVLRGTPIKRDTVAILETQGLTGIVYVDLVGGHNDSAPLGPGPGEHFPVIRSGPSLYARLDTAATTLLASVSRTSDSLNALLNEDNQRAVARLLADLQVVARTLAARASTIDTALADTSRTMKNAAVFTAELPRLVARIEQSADRFDRMSDAVAMAATSGSQAFDSTRGDLQQFTRDGLPELRQLVSELREATGSLQRLGSELERNASMLVWGRAPARRGPGE